MLILSRKRNEKILISDDIELTIIEIDGDKVRIGINAPKDIKVFRKELIDGVKVNNIESAETSISALEKLKEKILKKF